jgi:hypothetical protein
MKLFVLFAAIVAVSSAFDMKSYSPKSGSTTVKEGEYLDLWCNVNDWWEWCKFTNVPTGKICDLEWKKDLYNVTVLNCADFEGRFEFLGDYNKYKCGVRFFGIKPDEAGKWKCDIESYYAGQTRNYGYKVKRSFDIDVEIKTTTTTTTTTTSTASTTTDYYYYEETEDDEMNSGVNGTNSNNTSGEPGKHDKRNRDNGANTSYIVIAVIIVVVICLVIVLAALYYKRKLPVACYSWKMAGGKNFKPVDQNETLPSAAEGAEDPEDEAKHPSIVKSNGSNGVSPSKEAGGQQQPSDEAQINKGLTTVTWTSEKEEEEMAAAAGEEKTEEEKPLKEADDE